MRRFAHVSANERVARWVLVTSDLVYVHRCLGSLDEHVAALRAEPDSEEAAQRLRASARREGLFRTLAESLVERGEQLSTRDEFTRAADAYVEAALVYEEDLSDLNSAARCYERVLEIDAGHRQALFTLGLLLHDLGRWEDLIALYRRRIRQTEDPGEQTTFHMYVAEILEQRLDNSNAAFEEVMAAARLAPKNIRIVTRLQRLGEETKRLEEVAVSIGNLILHQEDPRVRAALSLRLAELHLGPLSDDNRALAYLRAALADDGGNPTVLHEVQDVFRERDRFDALAALLEESVEDRRIGPHRVRLERELARIYERELSDPDRALGALTRAADHTDGDRELLDEIMRLGAKIGEYDRVAETFGRVIERTDNLLLKTYLRLKLGHLFVTQLKKPEEAARIYQVILRDDPGHAEARRRLAQLKKPRPERPEPDEKLTADLQLEIAILPPMPMTVPQVSTPSGSSSGWARPSTNSELPSVSSGLALVEDSAVVTNGDEEPTEFVGQSYGPETDTEVFARMSTIAAEMSAAARAEEAEQADGDEGRLAAIQRELQEATRRGDEGRIEALLEEVHKANCELGQHERAFFAMVRLVRIDPTEARLEELVRLGRESESYIVLLETIDDIADKVARDRYIHFQRIAAEIEAKEMNKPQAALDRLARTYDRTDGDAAAREGWLALLDQEKHFADMTRLLVEAAKRLTDPHEAEHLVLRAAEIREHKEGDVPGAARLLYRYLDTAPQSDAARSRAMGLLEQAEEWKLLTAVIEGALGRQEESERGPLRLKKAHIEADKLKDLEAAEATIRRGLEERVRDDALLEALAGLLEQTGRFEELIDVLVRRADGLSSPHTRRTLRLKVVRIAEEELSAPERALEMLERMLAEDPADSEVLGAIERLRRSIGDWVGVRTLLESRVASERDPAALAALHTEIAELAVTRGGELGVAMEELKRALQAVPGHVPALLLSAEIAERRGDVQDAIDALSGLTKHEDSWAQSEAFLRIGLLRETRLSDPDGARTAYQGALEADATRLDVTIALLDAVERAEDWGRAQELAGCAAELADDPRQKASFWRRAGLIAKERLGDEAGALECYANVLQADPDDLDVQATIGLLYLAREEFEHAYAHLFMAASALSDPERAAELFIAASEAAECLGQDGGVIAALEAVLERAPQNRRALEQLRGLLVEREQWDRVHELGAHLILHHEQALTPAQRSAVYAEMARAKLSLENAPAALRLAKRARELDPEAEAPLELLTDAWLGVGEPAEAAECLKEQSTRLDDPEVRKTTLLRAGRLLAEEVRDFEGAAALMGEAWELAPNDVELAKLLSLYRAEIGDTLGAAEALTAAAGVTEGWARADLLVEASRVVLSGGRDRPRVKKLLKEALSLAPGHPEALEDLTILLEFDGELTDLAGTLQRCADALDAEEGAVEPEDSSLVVIRSRELRERAYDLYRERVNDPLSAARIGKKLGYLESSDTSIREQYARLLDEALTREGGDKRDLGWTAIQSWAGLVESDPGHVEGLERLCALGRDLGEERMARVAEELLVAVGATPVDSLTSADGGLTPADGWAELSVSEALHVPVDSGEELGVGPLLGVLGHAPLLAFSEEASFPRLRKKDAVTDAVLGDRVSRPLAFATAVVGTPPPLLFLMEEGDQAFTPALVGDQPALVVSGSATRSLDAPELRFLAGRALSLLRPRSLSITSLPAPLLREVLVGLGCPSQAGDHHVDPKAARRRARVLERHLSNDVHEMLVNRAQQYFEGQDMPGLWAAKSAVLRTADRVGLVTSGSLLAALRVVAAGSDAAAERERRPPLIRFAASRAFTELVRRFRVESVVNADSPD